MTKKKIGRYTYYIIPEQNRVKCVSSYAKKAVTGYAECKPEDTFNEDIGMEISRVKCDTKINKKRIKSLEKELDFVFNEIRYWEKRHSKLCMLMRNAEKEQRELNIANKKLENY